MTKLLDICIPPRKGAFQDKKRDLLFVFKALSIFHIHSTVLTTKARSNQLNTVFRVVFCNSITEELHVVYVQRRGKGRNLQKDLV